MLYAQTTHGMLNATRHHVS